MTRRTPEQKLAREIQAVTGRKYADCLREARARLSATVNGEKISRSPNGSEPSEPLRAEPTKATNTQR